MQTATATRTTTETSVNLSIRYDPSYFKTIPGILKVVCVVSSLPLGTRCLVDSCRPSPPFRYSISSGSSALKSRSIRASRVAHSSTLSRWPASGSPGSCSCFTSFMSSSDSSESRGFKSSWSSALSGRSCIWSRRLALLPSTQLLTPPRHSSASVQWWLMDTMRGLSTRLTEPAKSLRDKEKPYSSKPSFKRHPPFQLKVFVICPKSFRDSKWFIFVLSSIWCLSCNC